MASSPTADPWAQRDAEAAAAAGGAYVQAVGGSAMSNEKASSGNQVPQDEQDEEPETDALDASKGDDEEEEEEEADRSTEPITHQINTLSFSSAPAGANPWAESLPADPLAPTSLSSTADLNTNNSSSRSADPLLLSNADRKHSYNSATSDQAAAGTTAITADPTPSSTTYAREWTEYDGANFGVGLEKLGHSCARYWSFKPRYTNLNAGAFGACPNPVVQAYKDIQDEIESAPDYFVGTTLPKRLKACRERIAPYLNVSCEDIVFVTNTTSAFHSIIRDLPSSPVHFAGSDAILVVSTTYGAIDLNVSYAIDQDRALADSGTGGKKLRKVSVPLKWPIKDEDLLAQVEEVIKQDRSEAALKERGGKGAIRLAVFDAISSMPGVRLPWEKLVNLAKKYNIMTFIDGAHAIGQIELDLGRADPDFFVSNCHKWMYAHRGCAIFYVSKRHQHLVHSVPISWSYVPTTDAAGKAVVLAEDQSPANTWRAQWEFAGTFDWSSFCTIEAALDFRTKLGGERRIMAYTHWVAMRGGQAAAKILGTEMLEILDDATLAAVTLDADEAGSAPSEDTKQAASASHKQLPQRQRPHTASLVNIRLPLAPTVFAPNHSLEKKGKVKTFFYQTLWDDYRTAIPLYEHADRMWARMAGSVFLEVGDFEFGARCLLDICRRLNEDPSLVDSGAGPELYTSKK
ncbi:hypothetical protein OC861_005992 [Tilletia horrida]|nr:hypothetical protein OC861_005992 [Tilletia horrida]